MKAARVTITLYILEKALGFDFKYEIQAAQVKNTHYQSPELELIITGEDLDDTFIVEKGSPIKEAFIQVETQQTTATIVPVKEYP